MNKNNDRAGTKEQQLRAANQQLSESEQQLRAANQQLDASNQQLRANEQELRKLNLDLRERVKELDCLYGISVLVEKPMITLEGILKGVVDLIPSSWQYPEIACARIGLGALEFKTANFRETPWKQARDIVVRGEQAGTLEVCYLEERPESDEGPFLKEERNLISAIAERLERITDRERLEERLRHVQKMEAVGTLAGGLAHDINNILAGILGYTALLKESLEKTSAASADIESIERLSWRASDLTKALLAFSRKGMYRPQVLNIDDIIGEVLKVVGQTVGKRVDVKAELLPAVPNIIGDEGQLNQSFMNLCINACEAMPAGGRLSVRTAQAAMDKKLIKIYPYLKEGPYISVSISDNGTGMDPETRERVFEPFFTTKEDKSGTGLGLSMVIGIIEGHGGCIEVESELGKGSTFTVYLPATEEKIKEAPPRSVGTLRGHETILLVDDEEDFRRSTGAWLKELGYTVIDAASGEEAIRLLEKMKGDIDFVILDMIMKGMGGAEAFKRMRKMAPDIPIMVCTGYSVAADVQRLIGKGNSGFIQKPFEHEILSLRIRKLLDAY
ncbi:MAG: response regulator [Candidatus Tritonobacter lacicola]|nr:response regulator [Candidatus Tritonobacter lacicola]